MKIRLGRIRKRFVRTVVRPPVFFLFGRLIRPSDPTDQKWQFYGFFRVRPENGRPFWLYNNSFKIETGIYWAGIDQFPWERTTRAIWTHLCRDASTIFDIGANTGVFSMLAQSVNPSATVYAFEPQPNIFAVLSKNARKNGNSVRCEPVALAERAGILPFYNSGKDTFSTRNTTTGSLNRNWHPEDAQSITVEVKTLADYVEECEIDRIDLIKIDVETFEYEVLAGYGRYLFQHRPIIFLEIQTKEIGGRVASLFLTHDYEFLRVDEGQKLRQIESLVPEGDEKNFILCPSERRARLSRFVVV